MSDGIRRYLFLDIDGCLNSPRTWGTFPFSKRFDPDKVRRVWQLCQETGAEIVWSTAWRNFHAPEELGRFMVARGWPKDQVHRFIGRTPQIWPGERGDEIAAWLRLLPVDRQYRFCVFDDGSDMTAVRGQFIHIDYEHGIQDHHIEEARQLLQAQEIAAYG